MTVEAANPTAKKEKMVFQTEVNQLLKLMIHSLYSNKEIFIREIISNASDAVDKLRFEAVKNDGLYEGDTALHVKVLIDKDARTITFSDNGIGMSQEEVIQNIGTIARSGTKEFVNSLTGDQAKDSQLIGQFGVGFYSSFIVADKVTLRTRKAGLSAEEGVWWESAGEGDFELSPTEKATRGTEITLHLREGEDEFLESYRVRSIIKKYSEHISIPVQMEKPLLDEKGEEKKDVAPELEAINSSSALWVRAKKEIPEEEYNDFYKQLSYDFEPPLAYAHNHVEGKQSYKSLLYIPKRAPYDLWERDRKHGIKLYVKRVFIMEEKEHLLPNYLRFVRGVIDSDDLPLNVSREILQQNKLIETINSASTKRVLDLLGKMATDEPEKYQTFWDEFGKTMKEGLGEDWSNKDKIAKLLRFASTQANDDKQIVSLDQYVGRMKAEQDKIFFITGDTFSAVRNSPHLEIFRKKGIEVLLMGDRIDEWAIPNLTEYEGKKLVSIAKGDLDLGELEDEETKTQQANAEKDFSALTERMKILLEAKVKDVKVSHRLTDSPSCLVVSEQDMAISMQKLFKQAGHAMPEAKPTLEINPNHPIVTRLKQEQDEARFASWTHVLHDQALLSEGGQLENPSEFVHRMNEILLAMLPK